MTLKLKKGEIRNGVLLINDTVSTGDHPEIPCVVCSVDCDFFGIPVNNTLDICGGVTLEFDELTVFEGD